MEAEGAGAAMAVLAMAVQVGLQEARHDAIRLRGKFALINLPCVDSSRQRATSADHCIICGGKAG